MRQEGAHRSRVLWGEVDSRGRDAVSLQLHETHLIGHTEALRPLPRVRMRATARVALAGRLGLVFLPALTFSVGQMSSIWGAFVAAGAITTAWYAAGRTVLAATRPARAALGQTGATALASCAGAGAVSALALWVSWLSIRPLTVVQVAAAVFALQLAWER